MKVLILTPLGAGGKGGIDRMMDGLIQEFSVSDCKTVEIDRLVTRGSGGSLSAYVRFFSALAELAIRLLNRRCDLIHINVASNGSSRRKATFARLARIFGVPYVIHLHGGGYKSYYEAAPWAERKRTESFFQNASKVLVLGRAWHEFVTGAGLVSPERLAILPNATTQRSRAQSQNTLEPPKIVFLGEVCANKGIPQLLKALANNRDVPWSATIAGKGEIQEYNNTSCSLGISERVKFLGWVNDDQVNNLLDAHNILVLPSLVENLPMSVIEGMSAGLAIVATNVGATPDIVEDGVSGLLVRPNDVDELSMALRSVIVDRDLRQQLGKAAQIHQRRRLQISGYAENILQMWLEASQQ